MDGRPRVGLGLGLFLALCVVLVAFGAVEPDPADNTYPGTDEVLADPGAHVGERVAVSGTVIGTDPVVVRLENGVAAHEVAVTDVPRSAVAVGDQLSLFGTLTGPGTVAATRTVVRAPWELAYMYGVSLLGGLLVLGRLVRGFRLHRDRWAIVPRPAPATGPTSSASPAAVEQSARSEDATTPSSEEGDRA